MATDRPTFTIEEIAQAVEQVKMPDLIAGEFCELLALKWRAKADMPTFPIPTAMNVGPALAAAPCAPTSDETKLHSAAERALRALQAFPGFRAGDSPHAQRFNEMLVGAIHELRAALASSCAPTSAGTAETDGLTIDALLQALAECRDAFPVPRPGASLEQKWLAAIGEPLEVPAFVKAALASPVGTAQPTSAAPAGVQPVAWQWRRKGEPWTLEKTFNSEVFATTPDSEVRRLYAGSPPTPASEAVVQDAARYRFLKEQVKSHSPYMEGTMGYRWTLMLRGNGLDDAIDRLRNTQGERNGE